LNTVIWAKIRRSYFLSILGVSAEGVKEHEGQQAAGSKQQAEGQCALRIYQLTFAILPQMFHLVFYVNFQ
jgi:hypothetical protein